MICSNLFIGCSPFFYVVVVKSYDGNEKEKTNLLVFNTNRHGQRAKKKGTSPTFQK
ncbi:hypothetical protein KH172YL63_35660 [Bacillus sp. KH172YL63]|nr:hypothetical protein KH172YL63_35660 [Bacillus sp. KH172YL63]